MLSLIERKHSFEQMTHINKNIILQYLFLLEDVGPKSLDLYIFFSLFFIEPNSSFIKYIIVEPCASFRNTAFWQTSMIIQII